MREFSLSVPELERMIETMQKCIENLEQSKTALMTETSAYVESAWEGDASEQYKVNLTTWQTRFEAYLTRMHTISDLLVAALPKAEEIEKQANVLANILGGGLGPFSGERNISLDRGEKSNAVTKSNGLETVDYADIVDELACIRAEAAAFEYEDASDILANTAEQDRTVADRQEKLSAYQAALEQYTAAVEELESMFVEICGEIAQPDGYDPTRTPIQIQADVYALMTDEELLKVELDESNAELKWRYLEELQKRYDRLYEQRLNGEGSRFALSEQLKKLEARGASEERALSWEFLPTADQLLELAALYGYNEPFNEAFIQNVTAYGAALYIETMYTSFTSEEWSKLERKSVSFAADFLETHCLEQVQNFLPTQGEWAVSGYREGALGAEDLYKLLLTNHVDTNTANFIYAGLLEQVRTDRGGQMVGSIFTKLTGGIMRFFEVTRQESENVADSRENPEFVRLETEIATLRDVQMVQANASFAEYYLSGGDITQAELEAFNKTGVIPDRVPEYVKQYEANMQRLTALEKELAALRIDTPASSDTWAAQQLAKSREYKANATAGLGTVERFFVNTGIALGDGIALVPMVALPGGGVIYFGATTLTEGGAAADEALASGAGNQAALRTGAVSIAVDSAVEAIPIGAVADVLIKRFKRSKRVGSEVAQAAAKNVDELSEAATKAVDDGVSIKGVGGTELTGKPNAGSTKVNPGQQDKHILGTNNYNQEIAKGKFRSILTEDPQQLLDDFAGTGQRVGTTKERVEFGKVIGQYYDEATGTYVNTTKGIIHYNNSGQAHIVPARP